MSIPRDIVPGPDGVPVPGVEAPDAAGILDAEDVIDIGARQPVYAAGTSALWAMAARDIDRLLAAHRALLARIAGLEAERDHLKRRERDIIEATEPADDGQWRADIVGAIQRLRRERDADRAEAWGLREALLDLDGNIAAHVIPVRTADMLREMVKAALSREPAHVDVREIIRARDEQIRKALEEEIESIEASAPYRLNALRAFAARLGGPR